MDANRGRVKEKKMDEWDFRRLIEQAREDHVQVELNLRAIKHLQSQVAELAGKIAQLIGAGEYVRLGITDHAGARLKIRSRQPLLPDLTDGSTVIEATDDNIIDDTADEDAPDDAATEPLKSPRRKAARTSGRIAPPRADGLARHGNDNGNDK
jgi:hypothetical protein